MGPGKPPDLLAGLSCPVLPQGTDTAYSHFVDQLYGLANQLGSSSEQVSTIKNTTDGAVFQVSTTSQGQGATALSTLWSAILKDGNCSLTTLQQSQSTIKTFADKLHEHVQRVNDGVAAVPQVLAIQQGKVNPPSQDEQQSLKARVEAFATSLGDIGVLAQGLASAINWLGNSVPQTCISGLVPGGLNPVFTPNSFDDPDLAGPRGGNKADRSADPGGSGKPGDPGSAGPGGSGAPYTTGSPGKPPLRSVITGKVTTGLKRAGNRSSAAWTTTKHGFERTKTAAWTTTKRGYEQIKTAAKTKAKEWFTEKPGFDPLSPSNAPFVKEYLKENRSQSVEDWVAEQKAAEQLSRSQKGRIERLKPLPGSKVARFWTAARDALIASGVSGGINASTEHFVFHTVGQPFYVPMLSTLSAVMTGGVVGGFSPELARFGKVGQFLTKASHLAGSIGTIVGVGTGTYFALRYQAPPSPPSPPSHFSHPINLISPEPNGFYDVEVWQNNHYQTEHLTYQQLIQLLVQSGATLQKIPGP